MSTIGRVFIVINLVLAGAFVFIAGTFLQNHTHWKQEHEKLQAESDEQIQALNQRLEAASAERATAVREQTAIADLLKNTENKLSEVEQENEFFKTTLSEQGNKISTLTSLSTTMSEAIDRSTADSKQALDLAMQATQEKQEALNAKEDAEGSLSEAQSTIDELESRIADQVAQIAALDASNKEQALVIEQIKIKAPGILAMGIQPQLRGVVDQASASICTVRITDNPAEAEIKPGYTLAIYRDGNYKGEAVITEVEGDMVFCNVTQMVDGARVAVGDAAATDIAGM